MRNSDLPQTTERPVRKRGDESSDLPVRAAPQSHGRKSVVRGLPPNIETIMVVDDEPELIAILRDILEQNGYRVISATDGLQVFDVLKNHKPDLILLDIDMPQMNGLEVLARLKADRETSSIPVFFLTAQDETEDLITGYETGAGYYITKPFTRTQLMNGINRGLSWVNTL